MPYSYDVSGSLTAFTQTSLRTLQHAASIRLDGVFTVLYNSCTAESKPIEAYHKQCYQAYANKKASDKLQRSRDVSISESNSIIESEDTEAPQAMCNTATVRGTRRLVSPTNIKLCLFCQQRTKKSLRETTIFKQSYYFSACSVISNAAEIRKNKRILLEVQQGLGQPDDIAKELSYHEPCYRNYTHQKTLANMLDS